jgi:hypothetical protein
MSLLYGVDVSNYQDPARPDGVHTWAQLAQLGCNFAMVRFTYGTSRDARAVEHVRLIRAAGIAVGGYGFYRPSQLVTDQIAAFCAQALACGMQVGDLAPAIDIEPDGPRGAPVQPGWVPALEALASGLIALFGAIVIYETQIGFGELGKPAPLLVLPQWPSHYTAASAPATPNQLVTRGAPAQWSMWQKRVGPFVFNGPGGVYAPDGRPWKVGMPGPGPIDQSVANELVRCTRVPGATGSTPPPPDGPPPDHSHEDLIAARLAAISDASDFDGHSASDVTV